MSFGLDNSLNGVSYGIEFPDTDDYVPCSTLDHVLKFKNEHLNVKFHSFLDGSEIDKSNIGFFIEQVKSNIIQKKYQTTDHLFISVNHSETLSVLYVSLDNSVRANMNGFALYRRLDELLRVVMLTIKSLGKECIVFFSESCRPSFDGGMDNKVNEVSGFKIRQIIEDELYYLGECTNNEDANLMAFGISAYCTKGAKSYVNNVIPVKVLKEGFGSAALGVQIVFDKLIKPEPSNLQIIWGIHFPLDFKNKGVENMGSKTMVKLCETMKMYPGSKFALGDFNTIPGEITKSIMSVIPDHMELISWDIPTFVGAYYDRVKAREGEVWITV